MFVKLLLDPEPVGGGGVTDPPAPPVSKPDLKKTADDLVAKHGTANEAVHVLLGEAYKLRDSNRELKKQLPADGSIVLTADEGKALNAYKALGKPEEIATNLTAGTAAVAKVAAFLREKIHHKAAELCKFVPAVLGTLAEKDGLELVIGTGKDKAGKDVETASVKGEGEKTTPLAEYAEAHWKPFLPALKVAPAATAPSTPRHVPLNQPRPAMEGTTEERRPRRNAFT